MWLLVQVTVYRTCPLACGVHEEMRGHGSSLRGVTPLYMYFLQLQVNLHQPCAVCGAGMCAVHPAVREYAAGC